MLPFRYMKSVQEMLDMDGPKESIFYLQSEYLLWPKGAWWPFSPQLSYESLPLLTIEEHSTVKRIANKRDFGDWVGRTRNGELGEMKVEEGRMGSEMILIVQLRTLKRSQTISPANIPKRDGGSLVSDRWEWDCWGHLRERQLTVCV